MLLVGEEIVQFLLAQDAYQVRLLIRLVAKI
jgi:hypothetical protein